MQPTISNKCDSHRACRFEAAGTTAAARFRGCLTRRRCRTALFALGATTTSGLLFRCAVVLQNKDSQPFITTHSCFTSDAQPGVVHIHMEKRRQPQ